MATVYQNIAQNGAASGGQTAGYDGYVEPDTRVPPKAKPVLDAITVNGIAIAEADILAEAQNHPAETPGAALLAAARALVVRQLLLQEARRLNIDGVAGKGADGRREAPEDAAIRVLIETEVDAPAASEEECRRFHERNPDRFRSPTLFEARHILIAAPPGDKAARQRAKSEAERITAALRDNPGEFEAMARRFSACPSREQGGNLGQVTQGGTVPEFEAALQSLQEGRSTARPVETRYGFHVIRLERKIPGAPLPFAAMHDRIAAWLEARSWSKAVAQYIAVLAGKAEIAGIDIEAAQGPLVL